MRVRVGQREICRAQLGIFRLTGEAGFESVVIRVRNVLEFRQTREASRATAVQQTVRRSQHHGIDIFQRCQSVPRTSHVVGFENGVGQ